MSILYDNTFPNLEHVTLNVISNSLLNNFNIGHISFVLRDRAFIFGMNIPYDKTFPMVP